MADYKKGFYWSKHSNQKSANWHSWDLRAKTTECQLALLGGKGLKKYKVYNTLCPANTYNANLGRTRLSIKTLLNYIRKKKRNTKTYRKRHLTYKFKYRGFCYLKRTKIATGGIYNISG